MKRKKTNSTKPLTHIHFDDEGRPWIDDTNTKVIEVVFDHVAYRWSPEAIQIQHPHLSLAQIHAALAYYYDHKAEFDKDIERDEQEYEALLATQRKTSPLYKKLRETSKSS